MPALAIDFGTSNTVAMLRTPDGRVRPLLFDGAPLLPSAVHLGADGVLLVGRDAMRAARTDPARYEPNPKRRVDEGSILLGEHEVPVVDAFAAVLGAVVAEAHRQAGTAPGRFDVRLTHPARWAAHRRGVLAAAAWRVGLPAPELIAEPVAAAAYYTEVLGHAIPVGAALAVYDLGGGTFDAAVVRRMPDGFNVLADDGLPDVGGLDFDQAVVEHLGRGHAGGRTQTWHGVLSPAHPAQRRARELLYEDVRGAKEALSRTTSADVHLPALEVSVHLTRAELEELVRPLLARTVQCLLRTVQAARLGPNDLAGVFLVGGSSRIPLAAQLIHAGLGVAPTTLEQPETVVAEGALRVPSTSVTERLVLPVVPPPVLVAAAVPAPVVGPEVVAPPVVSPPARTAPAAVRAWYADPAVLGVIILLVLIVGGFAALLLAIAG